MDLFDTALRNERELRALDEMPPSEVAARKQIDHLDEHCRRYLALCRFALIASADADGRADVTLEQAEQRMIDSVTIHLA